MIIICSGPDTYRAREKARELVAAFRTKHDPQGLATEVLDGPVALEDLLSRLASTSLFSSKKFVRADGCLTKMKIADVRMLAAKLESDKDQTIVLTVEEEAPNAKTLEALKAAPLFHYPFSYQTGSVFRSWVREQATRQGVPEKVADAIAEYTEGDAWFAIQELEKQAANPHEIALSRKENIGSVFDVADAVLTERAGWRGALDRLEDDNSVNIFLGQARSYLRVRDGQSEGLHPYAEKKLSTLRVPDAESRMAKLLRAFIGSRSSLSSGNETETQI